MRTSAIEWDFAAPAVVGFASDLEECFELGRQAGVLPNIHGVLAARCGRIFFERYIAGPDVGRGRPLGVVRFGPETIHDMRSVTKSVVGLLYGIALSTGDVPAPDANLIEQFPEYPELAYELARQRLTIRHALSMTLGIEWDEFAFPYSDRRNSQIAMDQAPDRYRYILERPIVRPPGAEWTYSGGATALLGHLIAKGTGRSLYEFAQQALFEPLGITNTEWRQGADGKETAASGLRMTPRDLARIGVAILHGGQWKGRQVIPANWLAASFVPSVTMANGQHYGLHWYIGKVHTDDGAGGSRWEHTISAAGNGGQRLFLLPRLDLVVVVTAGNYDSPDGWRPPMAVLRDLLLPAMQQGKWPPCS